MCGGDEKTLYLCRLIIQLKYVIDMSENQKQVEKERKGVLELLLKKTGLKYKELVDAQVGMWMAGNLDLLTAEEKKQFPHLVF